MSEELLNYLIAQREERAARLGAYNDAVAEYNEKFEALREAEAKVDAFGDMSAIKDEIVKLDGFIEDGAVKTAGAVDTAAVYTDEGAVVAGEVAVDGAVTEDEEA